MDLFFYYETQDYVKKSKINKVIDINILRWCIYLFIYFLILSYVCSQK